MNTKNIAGIYKTNEGHWVGDGFPVRSLFSYSDHGKQLSPFLLLDYAGPKHFEPSKHVRGVEVHPHRGFETVTIVYHGEVDHRDSSGGGGHIGPGDVQWMTAAAGLVHEEFHSPAFTQQGGLLQMIQLWVNLPAKDKMTNPRYQTLLKKDIPNIELKNKAGEVTGFLRIIAGEYLNNKGAAKTFSPVNLWDLKLLAKQSVELEFTEGHSLAIVSLEGQVIINDEHNAEAAELVIFEPNNNHIKLQASSSDLSLLIMSGEPLNEPVAGYGPFVMNSETEIRQAMRDYQNGDFGEIKALEI